jgi:hypothetical protein
LNDKLQKLRQLGLDEQALLAVLTQSNTLVLSMDAIKPKLYYFTHELAGNLSQLKTVPNLCHYSLFRIISRHLCAKQHQHRPHKKHSSLGVTFFRLSDKMFAKMIRLPIQDYQQWLRSNAAKINDKERAIVQASTKWMPHV